MCQPVCLVWAALPQAGAEEAPELTPEEYEQSNCVKFLPTVAFAPPHKQAGAEEAPELTPEEYGRLVELVEQQEQGMR